MDECWNFTYCKEAHKYGDKAKNEEIGDTWNWLALDRPTKLILAYVVGRRTLSNAMDLTRKIRRATSPDVRFQLSSDALASYTAAVDEMLSDRCDYGQLVKSYTNSPEESERACKVRWMS